MDSWLYQELTAEELCRVIEGSLGTVALETRLLTGGLFNTTYFVKTAGFGDVGLDFCVYRWMEDEDFLTGYGPRPSLHPRRKTLYELMTRLWNVYVYQKEYIMPDCLQAEKDKIREILATL